MEEPTSNPGPTDMGSNAQIFSQQDVVAYLERKGLSGDTIKRLQIVPKGAKKKQSKDVKLPPVARSSSHNGRIRSASSNSTTNGNDSASQHSPRFYQEQYKLQQKSKRMRMIQNYSDAELLRMLHKKQYRRSKHAHKAKTRNKRRTASLGMRQRRKTKQKQPRQSNFSDNEHVGNVSANNSKESKAEKLKQLQKYYSLGSGPAALDQHHRADRADSHDDRDREREFVSRKPRTRKKRMRRQSRQKREHHQKSLRGSKSLAQLESVTDSTQLVHVMQKILGKDKSVAIEQYYKNLYSKHTARLPTIRTTPRSPGRPQPQPQPQHFSADEADHGHFGAYSREEHTIPPVMLTAMRNLEMEQPHSADSRC